MGEHARLAPSKAERWMNCSGSVAAEEAEPDVQNFWGAEGTVAHKVFEQCLKYGLDAADFHGRVYEQDGFEITVDDEMVETLQPEIDEILDIPGQHFYETRVPLEPWLPGQFGTLDVGILQPKKNLIIIDDLKYGSGLPVRAEETYQLPIYGGGFWESKAKKLWPEGKKPDFLIRIRQPRNAAGGGERLMSYAELMAFMIDVKRAGARTYQKNAPRVAGDKQCGYCKAAMAGKCKEYDAFNISKWGGRFEQYQKGRIAEPPDPDSMDAETRVLILDQAPALKQWLSRIHAHHVNACLAEGVVAGKKAVSGRKGRRIWKDEKDALEWLDDNLPSHADLYQPKKIISPSAAEKYLGKGGKDKLKPLVDQADGKPVLVPESDPRPAIEAYKERFTEFDEEDE